MEATRGNEVNQRGWNLKNVISLTQNGYHKGAQQNPKLNFDLERPAKEDMAEADSDGVLDVINETEIELTLRPLSYKRKKVETPLIPLWHPAVKCRTWTRPIKPPLNSSAAE